MAKKKKTGNFLKEIQKQSEEQRNQLLNEIAEAKKQAISKAEAQFEIEAEKYISRQLSIAETNIKSEYAVKALNAQGELFKLRDKMTKEVFEQAKEKLIEFSKSPDYKEHLLKSAKEIADTFENKDCIIQLKNDDMIYQEEIKALFTGNAEIQEDNSIIIGGIKAYSKEINIVADNTLDSKLDAQKSRFVEKVNLKIV